MQISLSRGTWTPETNNRLCPECICSQLKT